MATTAKDWPTVEQCWTLVGQRRGHLWQARLRQPVQGEPNRVAFDAAWVLAREEAEGDVVGFYHTHPSGNPRPSQRDDRTMRSWCGALGKPLLCLIEADDALNAYVYEDDEAAARTLLACKRCPEGMVLIEGGHER